MINKTHCQLVKCQRNVDYVRNVYILLIAPLRKELYSVVTSWIFVNIQDGELLVSMSFFVIQYFRKKACYQNLTTEITVASKNLFDEAK